MQQVKHTSMSSWAEFEIMLDRITSLTGKSDTEIMVAIGYTGSGNIPKWRADNQVPLRARYAVIGYLSELQAPAPKMAFTFDELIAMFGVLSGWQIPVDVRDKLSRKIAKEVTNGAG